MPRGPDVHRAPLLYHGFFRSGRAMITKVRDAREATIERSGQRESF